jgi:hypothetical protein
MTTIHAADMGSPALVPNFTAGCPTDTGATPAYGIATDGTNTRIAWTTTTPTEVNAIEYWTRDLPATRAIANGSGTAHVAILDHLVPGSTYGFRLHAARISDGAFVDSPSCTFSMPGTDRTPPYLTDIRVAHTDATTITVIGTTDEPAIGWAIIDPPHGISADDRAVPRTAHVLTVTGLTPATPYAIRIFVRDAAGNTTSSELPLTVTTLRDADRDPPTITDLRCTGESDALTIRFTVSESPATGRIMYGMDTLDRALEAAPIPESDGRTILTRRIDGLAPATNYRIRAIGIDDGGNAVESEAITCATW